MSPLHNYIGALTFQLLKINPCSYFKIEFLPLQCSAEPIFMPSLSNILPTLGSCGLWVTELDLLCKSQSCPGSEVTTWTDQYFFLWRDKRAANVSPEAKCPASESSQFHLTNFSPHPLPWVPLSTIMLWLLCISTSAEVMMTTNGMPIIQPFILITPLGYSSANTINSPHKSPHLSAIF